MSFFERADWKVAQGIDHVPMLSFALLKSLNGNTISRMLADHFNRLGRKTIRSVPILKNVVPPTVAFDLLDFVSAPEPTDILSAKLKRKARWSQRSTQSEPTSPANKRRKPNETPSSP